MKPKKKKKKNSRMKKVFRFDERFESFGIHNCNLSSCLFMRLICWHFSLIRVARLHASYTCIMWSVIIQLVTDFIFQSFNHINKSIQTVCFWSQFRFPMKFPNFLLNYSIRTSHWNTGLMSQNMDHEWDCVTVFCSNFLLTSFWDIFNRWRSLTTHTA